MPAVERDDEREERIHDEIVVDANGPEERAMGWYYYLDDQLKFPFRARCTAERASSPLEIGDEVEVAGLAPADDCEHEIFVMIPWKQRTLAVPLSQLEAAGHVDEQTRQAVEDWQYWVERGYGY